MWRAMNASALGWTFTATKYVQNITIAQNTGVITVTYDSTAGHLPQLGANLTVVFHAEINKLPLVDRGRRQHRLGLRVDIQCDGGVQWV